MPKLKLAAVPPNEDPDFLLCLDYIQHVEFERMSPSEYAALKAVNPSTVWRWQTAWTQRGLLQACREITGMAMFEDVIVANRRAVREWQQLLKEAVRIGLNAKSEFTRLQAIQWVYEKIVQPALDQQGDPGHQEKDFLTLIEQSQGRALDPFLGLIGDEVDDPLSSPASTAESTL